jgi:predicted nucleic acid-binding protein
MAARDEPRVFVDTNILLYAIDADAGRKHTRARKTIEGIWAARTGCLSAQVLSEWSVNLRKKLGADWRGVKRIVEPYLSWRVIPIEARDPLAAVRIADDHGLSYWDGLIVRAAQKARARFLLTEDLNPGQVIGGVEVDNPLLD